MRKLPVVSGAECVKALGKIGFEVYRQRGSHVVLVRNPSPHKPHFNHKSGIEAHYAQSSAKPDSQLRNWWRCFELLVIMNWSKMKKALKEPATLRLNHCSDTFGISHSIIH